MSDLSRLLDDVYGGPTPQVAATPPAPAPPLVGLPDWATDSVLDDAFSDWVTGPATAPVEAVDTAVGRSPAAPRRSAFSDAVAEPVAEAPAAEWCRSDDDILPSRRARGARRSRSSVAEDTAPAIEMFAAVEDPAPAKRGRLKRRQR